MTYKLNLKSSHEVIDTVNVADVESIFYCKPTDPDILTVLMKDGKRLYCDEVCPVDSLQEEPVSEDLEEAVKTYSNNLDSIYGSIGEQTRNAFKAGAEWQLNKLIKDAVEAEITKISPNDHLRVVSDVLPLKDESEWGTKVKLIIIKQEEE